MITETHTRSGTINFSAQEVREILAKAAMERAAIACPDFPTCTQEPTITFDVAIECLSEDGAARLLHYPTARVTLSQNLLAGTVEV